jgi:hypothetical protein
MTRCHDCLGPVPAGHTRCPRCVAVSVAGLREDAASVDARLAAVAAQRRYDERLGRRHVEPDDAWAKPTGGVGTPALNLR